MKRFLAVFLVALCSAIPASAQTLGTSASAPSPASSYATNTGLFSADSSSVAISSGAVEIMRVTGSGLGIGTSAPAAPVHIVTTSANTGVRIDAYVALPNPSVQLRAARGTPASPSALQSGDGMGSFGSRGYGATGFSANARASIKFTAAENWTDSAQGAYITFITTPLGSATNTERMRLDPSGFLGIGTTNPVNLLDLGPAGGIHIASGVPGSTNDALYNDSGTLYWDAKPLAAGAASAGRLVYGGSTTISYCPYGGNIKTTAAQGNYKIPAACLSASTTSLSANTLYYVYLWNNNSGTWVLDPSTTAHATDSTTGIEIKSGDASKTLVGMIHTDGSKNIAASGNTNTVATWDNRKPTVTECSFSTTRTTTSTSYAEVNSENRCNFLSWGDGATFVSDQYGNSSATGGTISAQIQLDGSTVISQSNVRIDATGDNTLLVFPSGFTPSEGYHSSKLLAQVSASSTATFYAQSGYFSTMQ